MNWYPLQKLAHATTSLGRPQRDISIKPTQLPEVLSIDEFKGNSGGEKYNSIIVDAEKHKVVDILPNRFENDLIKYFSQFPSKTGVKYFVCDMNPH